MYLSASGAAASRASGEPAGGGRAHGPDLVELFGARISLPAAGAPFSCARGSGADSPVDEAGAALLAARDRAGGRVYRLTVSSRYLPGSAMRGTDPAASAEQSESATLAERDLVRAACESHTWGEVLERSLSPAPAGGRAGRSDWRTAAVRRLFSRCMGSPGDRGARSARVARRALAHHLARARARRAACDPAGPVRRAILAREFRELSRAGFRGGASGDQEKAEPRS